MATPPALPAAHTDATDPGSSAPPPLPRRKRRWLKRIALAMLALVLVAAVGHWWWGRRAASALDRQLGELRAAGDPVTVEELNRWPGATSGAGDNAVPLLRGAGDLIDEASPAWAKFMEMDKLLPLTDAEAAGYEAVVKDFDKALAAADEAAARTHVDWDLHFKTATRRAQETPVEEPQ